MTLFAATFFLLLLLGTSTAIPWKKYIAIPEQQQLVTNPVPLFLQVFAPKEPALVFLPLYSNYVVYSLPFLTEYVELCAMGDALLVNCSQHLHLVPNAENFNNTLLLNATMGSLVQNYCRYCITERRSVADFEQTRHLYSNATSNDCGNGNLAFFVDKLYNRSNICYCPMMDKYGYQCDGYTQVGYTFAWEVFKYAVLVIAAFLMTLTILLLWIPECCVRCKLAKRDFHWCTKLSHFVQIQMHCVLFLSCDYLLMILDQILGLSYHSQSGTLLRSSRFAVGTFRLVAYFFVLLAYATTLIKWGNVFARSQEMRSGAALNLTHTYVLFWLTFGRILVIVYYVIVAICVLVLGIVYLVFSEPRILYLVAGSMLFLFFVVFPVGFSFYALRIYYTLRATKSSSKRTTGFTLLLNASFIALYALGTPIVLTYYFGWDFCGVFIGLFRNPLADFINLSASTLILYVLYNRKAAGTVYPFLIPKQTEEVVIEQPNKHVSMRNIAKQMIDEEANKMEQSPQPEETNK